VKDGPFSETREVVGGFWIVAARDLEEGRMPCVVGETATGWELILGRADLEACRGDMLCLEAALRRAMDEPGEAGQPPLPAAAAKSDAP